MLLISCLKYRFHKELLWHRSLSGKTNWGEMAQLRNSLYFSISNGKLCNNLCPVGRVCRLRKDPHYFLSWQAVQFMQPSVLGSPQNQMLQRGRVRVVQSLQQKHSSFSASSVDDQLSADMCMPTHVTESIMDIVSCSKPEWYPGQPHHSSAKALNIISQLHLKQKARECFRDYSPKNSLSQWKLISNRGIDTELAQNISSEKHLVMSLLAVSPSRNVLLDLAI